MNEEIRAKNQKIKHDRMTIEEQDKNRKEIAKFEGSMLVRDYHTSWNALMPVVKKIQRLEIPDFSKKKPVMSALMDVDIDVLFTAVSVFVKWYNNPVAP